MKVSAATTEYTIRDQERMQLAPQYFEWQARSPKPRSASAFSRSAAASETSRGISWRRTWWSPSISRSCIERMAETFPNCPNLVACKLDVQDPEFIALRRHEVDSIVCLNVLEHVRDDALALRHMHAVLPSGGRVVLIVPAFEALYGPIDQRLGTSAAIPSGRYARSRIPPDIRR